MDMQKLRQVLFEGPPAIRLALVALVAMLVAIGAAVADTYTWDQYADGDWSDVTRWTHSGGGECTICFPHTSDDDAIITNEGNEDNEIYLDDDYEIEDLTFSSVALDDNIVYSDNDNTARELTCDTVVLTGPSEVFVWENVTIIAE